MDYTTLVEQIEPLKTLGRAISSLYAFQRITIGQLQTVE